MYQKVYKFIQNLRWKEFWFLKKCDNSDNIVDSDNSDDIDTDNSDNPVDTDYYYTCFPTKQSALECEDLKHFEHDLYLLVKSIEFRKCSSPFQIKIKNDIRTIIKSKDFFISSDKKLIILHY